MILPVADFISERLPGEQSAARSVIRIETTTPVYLVFERTSAVPRWVVRVGTVEPLLRTHDILLTIGRHAPGLVPQSILCERWRGAQWIHVQTGVAGLPWFQLQQRLTTATAWNTLAERARDTLGALHDTVRQVPPWVVEVQPATELRRCIDANAVVLNDRVMSAMHGAARSLDRLGSVTWFAQHGDYCLNNLIVLDDRVTVIDFDEFGTTAMPLHDEFGLAMSLGDLMPGRLGETLAGHLRRALVPTLTASPWLTVHLESLFAHHLLWRMAKCTHQRRSRALAWIRGICEQHVARLDRLFDETRQAMCRVEANDGCISVR